MSTDAHVEKLGQALATLAALAAAAPSELAGEETLVALEATLSMHEAIVCRATRAFEASGAYALHGARSATSWLAVSCRLPDSTARRQLRLGRAMDSLPRASAGFLDGSLNGAHVALLGSLARSLGQEAVREGEELLVKSATTMRFTDFERVCRYAEQVGDPDGSEERDEDRRSRRDVALSKSLGGMVYGRIVLDPISGEIVSDELERLQSRLYEADRAEAKARLGREPLGIELRRTPAQRRADALVEMATRSAFASDEVPRPGPLFTVLVGYETLHGRICELASGAVVSPGSLLPYLDHSLVERVVFGPGRRVEVGATCRFFEGATRRAIEVRDRRCTHPFCDLPAQRCQEDHIVPFEAGGLTTQQNGRLLCKAHNLLAWRDWCALDEVTKARLVAEQRALLRKLQAGGMVAGDGGGDGDDATGAAPPADDEDSASGGGEGLRRRKEASDEVGAGSADEHGGDQHLDRGPPRRTAEPS